MGLQFLETLIADFLQKFKTSSPTLWLVIAAILTGLQFYFTGGGTIPGVTGEIVKWLLWAFSLFLGSNTLRFTSAFKRSKGVQQPD